MKTQSKREHRNAIEAYFSGFEEEHFVNKEFLHNFLTINAYDLDLKYQQQPIMRFIDFLADQIIIFLMEPHSLHKFDSDKRGPYAYENNVMTEKEVRKYCLEFLQPFYTNISVHAKNSLVAFNSFPGLKAIPITIETISVETSIFQKS